MLSLLVPVSLHSGHQRIHLGRVLVLDSFQLFLSDYLNLHLDFALLLLLFGLENHPCLVSLSVLLQLTQHLHLSPEEQQFLGNLYSFILLEVILPNPLDHLLLLLVVLVLQLLDLQSHSLLVLLYKTIPSVFQLVRLRLLSLPEICQLLLLRLLHGLNLLVGLFGLQVLQFLLHSFRLVSLRVLCTAFPVFLQYTKE